MVKTGQQWSGLVVTKDATGALATPSVGPAGVLYVDGAANGAGVTISGSNPYKWTVTLPALTAGQCVSMYITATIATIATASVVAEDVADTVALSDVSTALATVDGNVDDLLLVAPDNKPTVAATGEASANVTMWNGDTPADLDVDGNVPTAAGNVTPEDVWTYVTRTLTQSSTSTTDSTAAGNISRRRGDSWSISLTVGAVTGYTSLWLTVKRSKSDTDSQALLQIKKNAAPGGDGLLTVNGAAASNAALASITVVDANTGALTFAVDETVTDDLAPGVYYYDVQALVSGSVSTPDSGTFTVTADVTRSVA